MSASVLTTVLVGLFTLIFGSLVEGGRRLITDDVSDALAIDDPVDVGASVESRWRTRLLLSAHRRAHCDELPPHFG
ncbi:MAG TPA: hypothetical protein VNB24_09910 [Acidimicrobiales bacterium]|nr:hypothetical protein [Acidimicrobiales bacterium]